MDRLQDAVFSYDDQIVVVRDKFPKSTHHFLVMPREIIPTFADLKKHHLGVLKAMRAKGVEVQKKLGPKNTMGFRFGFHAVPSMRQVHMNAITSDFASDALKNKKHWNSFTTPFFVDADRFIGQLEDTGSVFFNKAENEKYLKLDLKCHKCGAIMKNMPTLKVHIGACTH